MPSPLYRELNRLFEDFVFPENIVDWAVSRFPPCTGFWSPRIDVRELENHINVRADLPGISKENVFIDINDGVVTISGEHEKIGEDKTLRISERCSGRFERRIGLPNTIDTSKIEAKMENGVLDITIPKSAEAQAKRITVK